MELKDISLKEIHASENNMRQDYNGTQMKELIASIKSVGLLNPIIVRKKEGQAGYEIVAGHRRFHAVTKLGDETIPTRIMTYTDEEAEQVRLVENLHRQDLNPIEEAQAFQILEKQWHYPPTLIAERADKSVAYVTRSLALLEIPKSMIDAIRDGVVSAEHGHQIARLTKDKQEAMAKFAITVDGWRKQVPTLVELKREIEKKVEKSLKTAVFPKDKAYAETIACVECPFNSGNQDVLFDGARDGSCTSPGCFRKKTDTFYKLMGLAGEGRWPGVKYIGAKNQTYDNQFAGFHIVNYENAKTKAKMVESPSKFFFGILKRDPSGYGNKKAQYVVVNANKTEKAENDGPGRDYNRERFLNERVNIALIEYVSKNTPEIQKRHILMMMDADDQKTLEKKSMQDLLKIMWLGWFGNWDVQERIISAGFDKAEVKAIEKRAINEAEKSYDATKVKK